VSPAAAWRQGPHGPVGGSGVGRSALFTANGSPSGLSASSLTDLGLRTRSLPGGAVPLQDHMVVKSLWLLLLVKPPAQALSAEVAAMAVSPP
jgi:hypothetical protein